MSVRVNELFETIKGQPVIWNGRIGLIQNGFWSPMADHFEINCVSIFNKKEYWSMKFSGHYIGQMRIPEEFFDMVFKQTPPDVLNNKLFKIVFS